MFPKFIFPTYIFPKCIVAKCTCCILYPGYASSIRSFPSFFFRVCRLLSCLPTSAGEAPDAANLQLEQRCFTPSQSPRPTLLLTILFVFLCFCVFVFLCFCVFVFLCFCLFVFLSFCLFVFLSFCLFVLKHVLLLLLLTLPGCVCLVVRCRP